jgi:glycine/D-amino acid oxidase-like deaminating enzyme
VGPPVDPVATSDRPPTRADVVVVGGGIVGLSTALWLARRGVSVVVLEKGRLAAEQSSRNWGWVRRMGRDPRELPLIVEALRQWDDMAATVGRDVGFRRSGILYLCESDADIARYEDWLISAGDFAFDTRLVRGGELAALLPGATRAFPAALHTPSDGRAEPQMAAPAIAAAAQALGATLVETCAVRAIETAGGRISGVATEKGPIACSSVVVAGGVWSSRLIRPLGLRLPQLGVVSSVLRTAPVEGGPEQAAWGPSFAWRKRLDGGYTIAQGSRSRHDVVADSFRYFRDFLPMLKLEWRSMRLGTGAALPASLREGPESFEATRVLDPEPWTALVDEAYAKVQALFPALAGVPVVQRWAGVIDTTPDAIPVISTVGPAPGLVVATGFSGHGFGIAPGAGRLAAELATGDAPCVDPTPFRWSRFVDGTWEKPTTGM